MRMGAKCVPRHEFLQHIAMERQRAPIQLAKGRVDCQRLAAGGGGVLGRTTYQTLSSDNFTTFDRSTPVQLLL